MRLNVRVAQVLLASTLVCGTAASQDVAGFRPLTDFAQLQSYPSSEDDIVTNAPVSNRMTLAIHAQLAVQAVSGPADRRFYTTRTITIKPRRETPPFNAGFGMPGFYGPYGWNKPYRWDGPYRYYGSFGWDWGGLSDKVVGKVLEKH
jgi:hypothetical protein